MLWQNPMPFCSRSSGPYLRSIKTLGRALHYAQNQHPRVSEEVRAAVRERKPVVALETAIYTHGFPYPENIALASHLESIVRANGGTPATVGVFNGVARVGFEPEELIELAASAGKPDTKKLSRRDLGYICGLGMTGRKLNGGTTIAGTMVLAKIAGIKVFATGGLGGVHMGGEMTMDISADLTELGRTPVAVISSGCKSFLDLRRTLEYLETQGVCVGTFADGRLGNVDLPAFWTRDSGLRSPLVIQDEKEAAAIIHAQSELSISSGMLFANPISLEHSIENAKMDSIVAEAIKEADNEGASGSDNTPFILKKIRDLTGGRTVIANKALIEANVVRGTMVAQELSKLELKKYNVLDRTRHSAYLNQSPIYPPPKISSSVHEESVRPSAITESKINVSPVLIDVLVAGSIAIDLSCNLCSREGSVAQATLQLHTSNPALMTQTVGGVGHNIANALHQLGTSNRLCSAVGSDIAGSAALNILAARGIQTSGIMRLGSNSRTAQYVAINDKTRDLFIAAADMTILEDPRMNIESLWKAQLESSKPKWLVVDANWDPVSLSRWIDVGRNLGARIAFEPVSAAKSCRLFSQSEHIKRSLGVVPNHFVDLASPNNIELTSMHATAREAGYFDRQDWWQVIDSMNMSSAGSRDRLISMTNLTLVDEGIPQQSIQLLPFIPCIITKLGAEGVLLTQLLRPLDHRLTSPEAAPYILCRHHGNDDVVGGVYLRLFPPAAIVPEDEIISVNGVGDTFLGIIIAGLAKIEPRDIARLIEVAQKGSVMTLRSKEAVSPEIQCLASAL